MTEKIIIDGVNVAGCEFFDYECSAYRQEYWESEDNTKDMCSSHPNCYFKQLKRLEQENKEEKKAYNECMHYLACMTEQRNKLKTALEEIRKVLTNEYYIDTVKAIHKINEVLTP